MTKLIRNKKFTRITALLLVVAVIFGTMFTLPVSAASDDKVTITFDFCYDSTGNIIKFQQTTVSDGYTVGTPSEELCKIFADGKEAYCIEPGHTLYSGNTLTESASTVWKNLGSAKQKAINLALLYGKPGSGKNLSGTEDQKWVATQLIVWEFVSGCRNTADGYKCTNTKFIDGICAGGANPGVKSVYNAISKSLANYSTVPSFASAIASKAETYEMKYTDGKYTLTLTDSNSILSDFSFKTTSGVSASVSGNKLTLTSSFHVNDAVTFNSAKSMPSVENTTLIPYTVTFKNVLKKWNLTVTKTDAETKSAQGDATLAGAVYGIYNNGKLVDKYTTDKNGSFTTSYYVCGDNWTLKEIEPSEGYLLDETEYHIGAEAKKYTLENNSVSIGVTEDILKGKISIIKHTDDGSTKIETPEVGAEFQVYLKSSGSYTKAKESERDTLICDEYGFAETKDLPYGTYTVHQTKGWNGTEFIADFDVFISENNKTYKYLINNASLESYVKIVKVDSETGKQIPYAGAGFQIFAPDRNKVTMKYTYPNFTEIDTFYTNSDGYLITPETLPYGKGYSVVEVQAPYGYVLDSTPIYFDITAENTTEENGVTIVKTEKKNTPQKGTITVEKTGEIFSNVTSSGEEVTIYQTEYSVNGLSSAVFEIYADEDITTPDGTVRVKKDELVATLKTNTKGTAISKQLYLGKYRVVEKTAPNGFVLNKTVNHIELTYSGQNEKVTNTLTSFTNDRQKVVIDLTKILEQDEKFNIGNNNEIFNVSFGLYADEDLKASNGTVIPKDGLIEIITCDEKGKATFTTDLPIGSYYVKEISTDSHYILSDKKYPVVFEYAGQDTATVHISVNDGEPIENEIIYGTIKGLKIDRETGENIAGALFGMFKAEEKELLEKTAILTAESNEEGIFTFENVPYGEYIIHELKPAEGYLPNEENYQVTISNNEEIIEITVENDKIPELKTTATIDGKKEVGATEVFTLEDVVEYKHLVPGKEYKVKGILMDKTTGDPLLIDEKEIPSETTFTPDEPSGEVLVSFEFDARYIKEDTDIVVFESLYSEDKELAVHADLEDVGQNVTVKIPKIGTKASIDGKKEFTVNGDITIDDVVSYKHLTAGKEYTIKGVLMDKATGKAFLVDGEEIRSEVTFTPETADGEVTVSFTFDGSAITKDTEIVAFETLYRDGKEIAVHDDIDDKDQTVTIHPQPEPEKPQTGDNSNLGFYIGLGSVAVGGLIAFLIIKFKKKDEDDE